MPSIRERLNGSFNRFLWTLLCSLAALVVVLCGIWESQQAYSIDSLGKSAEQRSADNRADITTLKERIVALEHDVEYLKREADRQGRQ